MDATVELLREIPYDNVTLRTISNRAGVAYSDVRAHFRSKDAIVAEIYLNRLRAAPLDVDIEHGAQERIATHVLPVGHVVVGRTRSFRRLLERTRR